MKGILLVSDYVNQVMNVSAIERYLETLPDKALNLGVRVLFAILFFFVGMQIIKLIRSIVRKAMKKANVEIGAVQFIDSFIKFSLFIVLLFMIASYFGMDAASLVALLGSAGVAIGLAVQGSLSNLAGGVLILTLKPFKVGDYIMDASGKEGFVTEIQIFYTKLLTADNRTVILPNGTLANGSIINFSTQPTRRIDVIVGVPYNADLRLAKATLVKMLDEDKSVLQNQDKIVFVDALDSSSVNLCVRFWVKSADYWTAKWRITENCKHELEAVGIEIPFNQLDVHLDSLQ